MASSRYDLREKLFMLGDVEAHILGNELPTQKQVLKVLLFNTRKLKLPLRQSATPDDMLRELEPEKLEFLSNQRTPQQTGFIGNIETVMDSLTSEDLNRIVEERLNAQRQTESSNIDPMVQLVGSSDSNPTDSQGSSYSAEMAIAGPSNPKRSRGTINVFENEKLVSTLDKCRVSERDASRLVCAVAEALNVDTNTLTLSKSAINVCRKKIREKLADKIKKHLTETPLHATVLHWDGKLIQELSKSKKVDRLPIIISDGEVEKILAIPPLENGTGLAQATAINEVLQDWGLSEAIKALCCDTTASNLGVRKGAAKQLELMLSTDLLYLPCRHHIFEIVLSGIYDGEMESSTAPSIQMFKNFQSEWKNINQQNYLPGTEDKRVAAILEKHADAIEEFIKEQLNSKKQPRDDYRELLLLSLFFMNRLPREQIKFYKPGAVSRARWMAIYCLKIFLFRDQFCLTDVQLKSITEICLFIVIVYIRAWYTAPLSTSAPNNDLKFVQALFNYEEINVNVSKIARKKNCAHLWYLSPEAVSIAFFDEQIPEDIKKKMVENLRIDTASENDFSEIVLPKKIRQQRLATPLVNVIRSQPEFSAVASAVISLRSPFRSSEFIMNSAKSTSTKKRKYMGEYIRYGFAVMVKDGVDCPQCVLCYDVLSIDAMRPTRLQRHLSTKHGALKEKPKKFFQAKVQNLKRMKLDNTGEFSQVNQKVVEASYEFALLIAKEKKPHTLGETLIKPCLLKAADVLLDSRSKTKLSQISLSNNTVKRRTHEMAEDIKLQTVETFRKSPFFAIQCEESTDIAQCCQLMVYVRFIYDGAITEEILFSQEMKTTSKAADVMNAISEFFEKYNILWEKLVGVCTDGAPSMLGSRSGFVTLLKNKNPNITGIHCVIHRQALAAKTLSNSFNEALNIAIKVVSRHYFIKNSALNTRLFETLCSDLGSEHKKLLFNTEVRWLSKGNMLSRLFDLRAEVQQFLRQQKKEQILEAFADENFQIK
ncbi:unnamed protein product [Brassicogethes aeneus]|uniref:SCAN domain-containing protein 3 n=1 Tax=Brassicogethes aeneus TaxID=1431903 RepID=A0A9P0ATM3_BRAAE|nr:unnamed protein product [Brassicogethes aeneus]